MEFYKTAKKKDDKLKPQATTKLLSQYTHKLMVDGKCIKNKLQIFIQLLSLRQKNLIIK